MLRKNWSILWCNPFYSGGHSYDVSILRSFVVLMIVFTIPGCGYRFMVEGPGPAIGQSSQVISEGPLVPLAIRRLENRTFEANLALKYTQYLRQQFMVASGAKVMENEQDADYLLKGAIESVTLPSLAFSKSGTQESRVTVEVKVQVVNRRTGKILWTQPAKGSSEFFVDTTSGTQQLQFNRVLQDRAIEQAGKLVARDLADRFLLARDQGTFPLASPNNELDQKIPPP